MAAPTLHRQKSAGLIGVSVSCSSPHNPGDDRWSLKGQLADSLSVGELRAWVEAGARARGKVCGGDEGHEMEAAGGLKIILISQGEQLVDDAQLLLHLGISPTCGAHGPTYALYAVLTSRAAMAKTHKRAAYTETFIRHIMEDSVPAEIRWLKATPATAPHFSGHSALPL